MYTDPIINAYIDLIKANTTIFKQIYQGEPTRLGASVFPCLLISKTATEAAHLTNSEDQHEVSLTFTVVTDIRNELSTAENDETIIAGVSRLYEIMEGRAADLSLDTKSLLSILRTNQLVSSVYGLRTDLSGSTRVDYGETLQQRDPAEWRIQGSITIVANFNQVR